MSKERFNTITAEVMIHNESTEDMIWSSKGLLMNKLAQMLPLEEGIYIHSVDTEIIEDVLSLSKRLRKSLTYGRPDKVTYEQKQKK